jgi:hypothetical protein
MSSEQMRCSWCGESSDRAGQFDPLGWVCSQVCREHLAAPVHLDGGITLAAELHDAWEGSGSGLTFIDWVREMSESPAGTLRDAALAFLASV